MSSLVEMSQSRATVLFITGCVTFPGALLLLQRVWFNTAVGAQIRKKLGFTDKDCTDISVKYDKHNNLIVIRFTWFFIIIPIPLQGDICRSSRPCFSGWTYRLLQLLPRCYV